MLKTKQSDGISPWTDRTKQMKLKYNSCPDQTKLCRNKHNSQKRWQSGIINFRDKFSRNLIFSNNINTQEQQSKYASPFKKQKNKNPSAYKVISFQFNQQIPKHKQMQFNLKQLKHYTQRLIGFNANKKTQQYDLSQNLKVLKVKRYSSEEKNSEQKNSIKQKFYQKIGQQPQIQQLDRSAEIKIQKLYGIKVVKGKKISLSSQEVIARRRLYQQINSIYDDKNNMAGHLSLMKKNYNIKKLQKLVKNKSTPMQSDKQKFVQCFNPKNCQQGIAST